LNFEKSAKEKEMEYFINQQQANQEKERILKMIQELEDSEGLTMS
jgi:hypothetical protein